MRRIFGPYKEEGTGDRRKFHKEALRNLYISRSIRPTIVITSSRLIGQQANTKFLLGYMKERDGLEDLGVTVGIILNYVLKK